MLKVNRKDLQQFLNFLILKGAVKNITVNMIYSNNMLSCIATTTKGNQSVFGVKGIIKNVGSDSKEELALGIENIQLLEGIINSFDAEVINLEKKNNKLEITADGCKTKAHILLRSQQYILNTMETSKFDGVVAKASAPISTMSLDEIERIMKFSNLIGKSDIEVEIKNKLLTFKIKKQDNDVIHSVEVENDSEVSINLPEMFFDVLGVINTSGTGVVGLMIRNTTTPIIITVNTDTLEFQYLIAPLAKTE